MEKVLIFFIMFCVVVPVGTILARAFPPLRHVLFLVMLYFMSNLVSIHLYPIPEWKGTIRGFPFSMVDFLSLIVFFSLIVLEDYKFVFFPKGSVWYFLYFAFGVASLYSSTHRLESGMELQKMVFMYIFFVTCYNYIMYSRKFSSIIHVMAVTLIILLLVSLYQRYYVHMHQTRSTFPHQNSMGLFVIIYVSILLGVLFNEEIRVWEFILSLFGVACGAGVLVLGLSRGSLACLIIAVLLVFVFSLFYNGVNKKKIFLLIGLLIAVILPAAKAAPNVYKRFMYAPESSKNTRVNLARAAVRIAGDYPLGVGLNNFSNYSGITSGYADEQYTESKATVLETKQGGIVETVYLLVAAECGWGGLIALLLWFLCYWRYALLNMFHLRYRHCFGIAVGIFAGWSSNLMHSSLEWSLKQSNNFYQIMFIFAFTAALYVTNQERRRGYKQEYDAKLRNIVKKLEPWRDNRQISKR